jgi:hypothetical protein
MSQNILLLPHETTSTPPAARGAALQALRANLPLSITAMVSLALILIAGIGLLADPRVITGMPAWVKPLKFGMSFAIYSLTLIWLLTFVRGHSRLVTLVSTVTATASILEMAIIALQVVRGTTSHYNESTPLDAALWQVMGTVIMPIWLMGLLLAILLTFQRFTDSTFAWSLRLGVVLSLVGMVLAFPMTDTTPHQMEQAQANGGPAPISGAHTVGADDGGSGLPFVGWSTEVGDLRIAHFVGLHGLQVLPLAGFIINRAGKRMGSRHRAALVWLAGLGYLGLTLLFFWQAVRGQSIVAPDMLTLAVLGALAVGVAGLGALVVAHARTTAAPDNG